MFGFVKKFGLKKGFGPKKKFWSEKKIKKKVGQKRVDPPQKCW